MISSTTNSAVAADGPGVTAEYMQELRDYCIAFATGIEENQPSEHARAVVVTVVGLPRTTAEDLKNAVRVWLTERKLFL